MKRIPTNTQTHTQVIRAMMDVMNIHLFHHTMTDTHSNSTLTSQLETIYNPTHPHTHTHTHTLSSCSPSLSKNKQRVYMSHQTPFFFLPSHPPPHTLSHTLLSPF